MFSPHIESVDFNFYVYVWGMTLRLISKRGTIKEERGLKGLVRGNEENRIPET